jgi:hypothetical protein
VTRTKINANKQIDQDFLTKYPKNARILPYYDQEYVDARIKETPKVYYDPKNSILGDDGMCEALPYYNCSQYGVCQYCHQLSKCFPKTDEDGEPILCEE